jgi:hypothetical protein
MLFIESILISFFSIIPIIYIAYNRSNKNFYKQYLTSIIILCIKYIIIHYVFHYSGFYL